MAKIHIILNGKGGIGKSFISSLLIQYFQEGGGVTLGIDTDPNNSTILNIKGLKAKFLKLLNDDGVLVQVEFDKIIELIEEIKPDNCIIDSGATTFNNFLQYLKENECVSFFESMGHEVIIHVPIVAGQEQQDTLEGLANIAESFDCGIVIWKNEKNGSLANIEEDPIVKKCQGKITGWVEIKERAKDTFGEDIRKMTKKQLTFNEAIKSKEFITMSKQRLKIIKNGVWLYLELLFPKEK